MPRWILLHDDGERAWGQWLFDRGCIGPQRIACVVVSAGSRLQGCTRESIGEAIAQQVARQLELPLPHALRTVIEKRATIRCTPGRPRIAGDAFRATLPGVWLAGDWVDDEYPATLETAVRSGRRAARWAAAATRGSGPAGEALPAPAAHAAARAWSTRSSAIASTPSIGRRGALARGSSTCEKPSLAASRSRSWPRGAGRISPARPTSPNAATPRGSARFFSDETMASS